jgi:hypothetical protein
MNGTKKYLLSVELDEDSVLVSFSINLPGQEPTNALT